MPIGDVHFIPFLADAFSNTGNTPPSISYGDGLFTYPVHTSVTNYEQSARVVTGETYVNNQVTYVYGSYCPVVITKGTVAKVGYGGQGATVWGGLREETDPKQVPSTNVFIINARSNTANEYANGSALIYGTFYDVFPGLASYWTSSIEPQVKQWTGIPVHNYRQSDVRNERIYVGVLNNQTVEDVYKYEANTARLISYQFECKAWKTWAEYDRGDPPANTGFLYITREHEYSSLDEEMKKVLSRIIQNRENRHLKITA